MVQRIFGQVKFVMQELAEYRDYARIALEQFVNSDEQSRNLLVGEIDCERIEKVLDVGCGAGQELLPFAEKFGAFCVGVDVGKEVGKIGKEFFAGRNLTEKVAFSRSQGEFLPFAAGSFDVVICRLALPYMNNRKALAEFSRVLKTDGKLFLKIHAPQFYFGMIRSRIGTLNPKQVAYPLISLAGGTKNILTGKQPEGQFWKGKEIFQTEKNLRVELAKIGLRIEKYLPDNNPETPSFLITKTNR